MLFLKILFLFITVLFTIVNIGRLIKDLNVPIINIFLWAIGITGFITIFYLL